MSYLVCNGEKQSPLCTVENVPPQAPSWWFHPQNQTGTWCESPSHSCKREEEDVDTRLQQRVYQLTSTTCEPGNGNSHHCLHYRFAVLKLHGFLPFFFFFITIKQIQLPLEYHVVMVILGKWVDFSHRIISIISSDETIPGNHLKKNLLSANKTKMWAFNIFKISHQNPIGHSNI